MTVFAGDNVYASDTNNITDRARFECNFGTPSIANNTVSTLTPSAANVNVGSMWSSGTDITVPSAGEYEIGVVLRYATNATNFRQTRIQVNGSEYMQWTFPAVTGFNTTISGVIRIVLAASDKVSFAAFQNSGGALSLTGNSRGWVERVVQ